MSTYETISRMRGVPVSDDGRQMCAMTGGGYIFGLRIEESAFCSATGLTHMDAPAYLPSGGTWESVVTDPMVGAGRYVVGGIVARD